MSLQKWKVLARRLVEHYYKEKDKAIKDYKSRSGVSSDFYERVPKSVTEKIGEHIKETGKTGREDTREDRRKDRANAGASIARTTNTSTACTQKEAYRIHCKPRLRY